MRTTEYGRGKWVPSVAATAVLALVLSGCGGGSSGGTGGTGGKEPSGGPLTQASEPVQALYKASCQSCHGVDLTGRAGPTTNLQHVGGKLSQERIAAQITNGGGNMPAFGAKLKPDEVNALAAWLAGMK